MIIMQRNECDIDYEILLQRSIEDKLTNLRQEKEIIKEEIDRISPELQKVIL